MSRGERCSEPRLVYSNDRSSGTGLFEISHSVWCTLGPDACSRQAVSPATCYWLQKEQGGLPAAAAAAYCASSRERMAMDRWRTEWWRPARCQVALSCRSPHQHQPCAGRCRTLSQTQALSNGSAWHLCIVVLLPAPGCYISPAVC